jgi:hypothetical protein
MIEYQSASFMELKGFVAKVWDFELCCGKALSGTVEDAV